MFTNKASTGRNNLCGLVIEKRRKELGKSQRQLADMLQIGRTMYRRYETGETEIPIRHLKTICLFFGVSADYFPLLPYLGYFLIGIFLGKTFYKQKYNKQLKRDIPTVG